VIVLLIPCLSLTVIHPVPPPSIPSVPILELNCFIRDDDPRHIFPVKIARTESVSTLKKLVKEEKKPALDHINADALELWMVDIPVKDGFAEGLELRMEDELSPVVPLLDVFSDPPTQKHLHIIVVCDPPTSKCEHLTNLTNLTMFALILFVHFRKWRCKGERRQARQRFD
jgi:hypothetical protein